MKSQVLFVSILLLLGACGHKQPNSNNESSPTTEVTLTHVTWGSIPREITLTATTAYLGKAIVSAPISGFITSGRVQIGSRVRAGQVIYRLQSKEQHALGDGSQPDIPVCAGRGGIVLDVQQQAGGYVNEGTVMCTIADIGSLSFEINVPYELRRYAHSGSHCTIVLPDGTQLSATVSSPLATMNQQSQSEKLVAHAKAPFLPEGMNVKAVFKAQAGGQNKMILPKSAVMCNETLSEYWIMKVNNDGTAIKVPVEVGNSNSTYIEIVSGNITPNDNIILTGGYGLEDGARVTIAKK